MSSKSYPYSFRLNDTTDKSLVDMIDSASNRTDFIKNALFYYYINISKGNVHDRELPVGWGLNKALMVAGETFKPPLLGSFEESDINNEDDIEDSCDYNNEDEYDDNDYIEDNVEVDIDII